MLSVRCNAPRLGLSLYCRRFVQHGVRNCESTLMQLWKCFAVSMGRRCDLLAWRCIRLQWRKCRQLQRACKTTCLQSKVTVRASSAVLAIWVAWSSCQKIKMMQCALFYCDLSKQKMSTSYLRFVNIATSPDRTEQIFPAGCFNFAQMKASVELCINKLSGGWCRWYTGCS